MKGGADSISSASARRPQSQRVRKPGGKRVSSCPRADDAPGKYLSCLSFHRCAVDAQRNTYIFSRQVDQPMQSNFGEAARRASFPFPSYDTIDRHFEALAALGRSTTAVGGVALPLHCWERWSCRHCFGEVASMPCCRRVAGRELDAAAGRLVTR